MASCIDCENGSEDNPNNDQGVHRNYLTRNAIHNKLNQIGDIINSTRLTKRQKHRQILAIISSLERRSVNQNGMGTYIGIFGVDSSIPTNFGVLYTSDIRGELSNNTGTCNVYHVSYNAYIDSSATFRSHPQRNPEYIPNGVQTLHGHPSSEGTVALRVYQAIPNAQLPQGRVLTAPLGTLTPATGSVASQLPYAVGSSPGAASFGLY